MPQLIACVERVGIKHLHVQKDETTLGRKPHNDIVVDNMVVSDEYCMFELRGIANVFIEDLHSTNGTCISWHMIKSRQQLYDHDVIAIGKFKILFLAGSAHEKPESRDQTTAMPLGATNATGVLEPVKTTRPRYEPTGPGGSAGR